VSQNRLEVLSCGDVHPDLLLAEIRSLHGDTLALGTDPSELDELPQDAGDLDDFTGREILKPLELASALRIGHHRRHGTCDRGDTFDLRSKRLIPRRLISADALQDAVAEQREILHGVIDVVYHGAQFVFAFSYRELGGPIALDGRRMIFEKF